MTRRPRLPPLADTLAVLLPDAQDSLLLRACLADAPAAAAAWEGWLALVPDMPTALAGRPRSRRLLPLLHQALNRQGIALAEPTLAILRAASLWEEQRAARIRTILALALASLRRAGIAPALLKGVALAETTYPRFQLRHCHDLDLLVDAEALPMARAALVAAGFHPAAGAASEAGGSHSLLLQHADGLPLNLHTRLWATGASGALLPAFRSRASVIDFDGESVAIFAPIDMLLHVCAHAGLGVGPGSWMWIADAATILARHPPAAEDWTRLVRLAGQSGAALLLALRFGDLAARFDLPVPPGVLKALVAAARRSPASERDAAITTARSASGLRFVQMLRQSGWRSRLDLARYALRRSRRRLLSE